MKVDVVMGSKSDFEIINETKNILAESEDLQMPEFVKKLIEKKGRENVKMPYLIKKMLEKAGKLPKE